MSHGGGTSIVLWHCRTPLDTLRSLTLMPFSEFNFFSYHITSDCFLTADHELRSTLSLVQQSFLCISTNAVRYCNNSIRYANLKYCIASSTVLSHVCCAYSATISPEPLSAAICTLEVYANIVTANSHILQLVCCMQLCGGADAASVQGCLQ